MYAEVHAKLANQSNKVHVLEETFKTKLQVDEGIESTFTNVSTNQIKQILKIDPDISCRLDALNNEFKRWMQRTLSNEEKQKRLITWVKSFSDVY